MVATFRLLTASLLQAMGSLMVGCVVSLALALSRFTTTTTTTITTTTTTTTLLCSKKVITNPIQRFTESNQ